MGSQTIFSSHLNKTKMLLLLLASSLLPPCRGEALVVDMHISEHGVEYEQKVEYDPITKAVTYKVPKHHDIVASTTIIHKPTVCSGPTQNIH